MKVIDLLNKIANGEEVPKKIKWYDIEFVYSEYDKDYLEYPFSDEEYQGLFNMKDSILTQYLDREVEIIEDTSKEDKKIEKVNRGCIAGEHIRNIDWHILVKLDEIIDRLNGEDNE